MSDIMSVSNEREVLKNMKEVKREEMEVFEAYMDRDIMERVHFELAPCTNYEFLKRYCELDDGFDEFIDSEFGFSFE